MTAFESSAANLIFFLQVQHLGKHQFGICEASRKLIHSNGPFPALESLQESAHLINREVGNGLHPVNLGKV